jgi:hypothetical protein
MPVNGQVVWVVEGGCRASAVGAAAAHAARAPATGQHRHALRCHDNRANEVVAAVDDVDVAAGGVGGDALDAVEGCGGADAVGAAPRPAARQRADGASSHGDGADEVVTVVCHKDAARRIRHGIRQRKGGGAANAVCAATVHASGTAAAGKRRHVSRGHGYGANEVVVYVGYVGDARTCAYTGHCDRDGAAESGLTADAVGRAGGCATGATSQRRNLPSGYGNSTHKVVQIVADIHVARAVRGEAHGVVKCRRGAEAVGSTSRRSTCSAAARQCRHHRCRHARRQ